MVREDAFVNEAVRLKALVNPANGAPLSDKRDDSAGTWLSQMRFAASKLPIDQRAAT